MEKTQGTWGHEWERRKERIKVIHANTSQGDLNVSILTFSGCWFNWLGPHLDRWHRIKHYRKSLSTLRLSPLPWLCSPWFVWQLLGVKSLINQYLPSKPGYFGRRGLFRETKHTWKVNENMVEVLGPPISTPLQYFVPDPSPSFSSCISQRSSDRIHCFS